VVRRPSPVAVRVGTFLLCGVVAAALGAVFQRVSAARVDIDDLGAFNAILAVVGGTGLLGLGLQVVVVRQRLSTAAVVRFGAAVTVVTVAAGVAAVPGAVWYRLAVALLLGAVLATTFAGLIPRSRLLLRSSWIELGIVYLVGGAARLAALLPLLALIDTQVLAAVAATLIAESAMVAAALVLGRRAAPSPALSLPQSGTDADADAGSFVTLAPALAALIGLWLLTIVDTLLVRLRLDAVEADAYALASTVARASFFMALLVAHLAVPTFMRERGRSPRLKRSFNITTVLTAAVALVVTAAVLVRPVDAARVVLGDEADSLDPAVLRLLAASWACLSLIPLLTFFAIDRHRRLTAMPFVAAAAIGVGGLFVEGPSGMAQTVLAASAACLVVMGVPALQRISPLTRARPWDGLHPASDQTVEPNAHVGLEMVVPFYNPGPATLIDTVSRLADSLHASGRVFRIVAVSDGSTDDSAAALRAAAISGVQVIEAPVNRGKGAALRLGFETTSAPLVGFIDADGDLPPEQVVQLLDIAEATDADAVVGSKLHPASVLSVASDRRLMSSVFQRVVRVCFRLDVRDTQTGVKIYRGSLLTPIAPLLAENGFAIDVEILVAARRARSISVVEAPVTLVRAEPSATTVSLRGVIATAAGLARIFWRDRVAMRYDQDPLSNGAPVVAAVTTGSERAASA
jgi:hypothetical protein